VKHLIYRDLNNYHSKDSPASFQILVFDVLPFLSAVYWLNYVAVLRALSNAEQDNSRHLEPAKLLDPCTCPLALLQQAFVVLPEDEFAIAGSVFHSAVTHLKIFL
jgi:hypothetical protein